MRRIDRDIDRILARLRNSIREQGFTQQEVQETLGWGRRYISQLLTKQKSLRFDQVLMILKVVDVDPAEFFGEIYQFDEHAAPSVEPDNIGAGLRRLGLLFEGLVDVLKRKNLISASDLTEAIKRARAVDV